MNKIEWFTRVALYRGKDAPFGQPFVKGPNIYSTDGRCILRAKCESEEEAEEFNSESMDLGAFWKNLSVAYKGLTPKGKIDALLLKEMAGDPLWEKADPTESENLLLDGAYFYTATIAKALAGWEEPMAKFGRIVSKDMAIFGKGKKKVMADTAASSPIVLTGMKAQVIILPFEADKEGGDDVIFPESALVMESV